MKRGRWLALLHGTAALAGYCWMLLDWNGLMSRLDGAGYSGVAGGSPSALVVVTATAVLAILYLLFGTYSLIYVRRYWRGHPLRRAAIAGLEIRDVAPAGTRSDKWSF